MYYDILYPLAILVPFSALQTTALPSISSDGTNLRSTWSSFLSWTWQTRLSKRQDSSNFETGANGSKFLWLIQDTYEGKTFFEWVPENVWILREVRL
jgi:hypothetical protein